VLSSCDSKRATFAILVVTAACLVFGWVQNTFHPVGGPISFAKVLWLNLALLQFYVVPFWLWRDPSLEPSARAICGWVLASFAVRAPIELCVIYFTRLWRCEYGIAHDLFTLLLVAWLSFRRRGTTEFGNKDVTNIFIPLLQVTLVVEMFMAWEFHKVASPAAGTYFAAPTAEFSFVNRASWIAVAVLYPPLAWLVWKSRRYETL
jgi:hypothetical protein